MRLGVGVAVAATLAVGVLAVAGVAGGGEPDRSATITDPSASESIPTETVDGTEPADPAVAAALSGEQLAEFRPNEAGVIPVLEYHLIEPGENGEYTRSPESFRADLEWLVEHGFFPINFRDVTSGDIDVPVGRSPVVLTFDDSSIGQFRLLDDGTVDPTSAMGIMLDVAEQHPEFPAVATFFPLLDVDVDSRILWGQPDSIDAKLKLIIESGGEIGSHTVSHERLDQADTERVQFQLGTSMATLQDRIETIDPSADDIVSLALPLGMYPADEGLIRAGSYEGRPYEYTGAAEVAGGPSASPFSVGFDPYHVSRTQAIDGYLDDVFADLIEQRDLVFISDGDPQLITVPSDATLDGEQAGSLQAPEAWPGEQIVRYERA